MGVKIFKDRKDHHEDVVATNTFASDFDEKLEKWLAIKETLATVISYCHSWEINKGF